MATEKGGLGPQGYKVMQEIQDMMSGKVSARTDGLDALIPNKQTTTANIVQRSADADFGAGWDVLEPAPSRNLGRNRAQKAAYSPRLMVLIIIMRDDSWIRYDGVMPSTWLQLKGSRSTNDFVQWNLNGHPWRKILPGDLPPTPPSALQQGMQD